MKQFIIENGEKRCPDCGEVILEKWQHCYNLEWCSYCGYNINEVFPKTDVKETDFENLPVFKPE